MGHSQKQNTGIKQNQNNLSNKVCYEKYSQKLTWPFRSPEEDIKSETREEHKNKK